MFVSGSIEERMQCLVVVLSFVLIDAIPGRLAGQPNQNPASNDNQYQTDYEYDDNQKGCTCVPHYNCDDQEDGAGLIDIRQKSGQKNQCPNVGEVCCENPKASAKPLTQSTCGITLQKEEEFVIDPRILSTDPNGGVAPFAKYPWIVALLIKPNKYKCGGSLIHPRVVLTAAHCIDGVQPASLIARLGEWDTQSDKDHALYNHQDFDVADVRFHEKYQPGSKNLYDDIALILLKKKAELSHHINTVCLPQPNQNFNNQRCYAAGWGREYFGKGIAGKTTLKEVNLPIIDRKSCQNRLKGTKRLGCKFCLHDTFICAGGEEGKDTCQGDGGSPLVCFINGVGVQAGIVAWGIGCGNNIPAAYVDVTRYLHWIDKEVKQFLNMQSSYFSYVFPKFYQYEGNAEFSECRSNLYNAAYNRFPAGHQCQRLQG